MRLFLYTCISDVCVSRIYETTFIKDTPWLKLWTHILFSGREQWDDPSSLTIWWWGNWSPERRSKFTLPLIAETRAKIPWYDEVVRIKPNLPWHPFMGLALGSASEVTWLVSFLVSQLSYATSIPAPLLEGSTGDTSTFHLSFLTSCPSLLTSPRTENGWCYLSGDVTLTRLCTCLHQDLWLLESQSRHSLSPPCWFRTKHLSSIKENDFHPYGVLKGLT